FSSRRRHTRCLSDWSSDVCSSDLSAACGTLSSSPAAGTFTPRTAHVLTVAMSGYPTAGFWEGTPQHPTGGFEYELARAMAHRFRSEERRVGKERGDRVAG